MITAITKEGIEQVIINLNYQNKRLPKYRYIQALMQFYEPEDALDTVKEIDSDTLIKIVWDIGDDPKKIASKRKNLTSIRSAINNDLKKLYENDENPEGISIGALNTFVMSDDVKEKLLTTFTTAAKIQNDIPIEQIVDVLSVIGEFMDNLNKISEEQPGEKIKKILDAVKGLLDKMGMSEDIEDYQFIKKDDMSEQGEDSEENMNGEEDDIIEVDEDDIIEVDEDDIIEEVEDDEIEEVEDDDLQEVEEEGLEDVEEVEDDEIEEVDEDDIQEVDEEDIEDVEEDNIEEVDDDEIEEVEEDDIEEVDEKDIEEVEDDEIEEVDEDDIQEVDEEDIEDVEEDDLEEVDEDDIEEVEDDEVEEVEETEESSESVGLPLDNLDKQGFEPDKNVLTEQFDGYLGAMERFYNQYLKIPAGRYTVGSQHPGKNDLPIREIRIQEIHMGKYPVTNAIFEIFIERSGYQTTAEKLGYGWVYKGRFQKSKDSKTGNLKSLWHNTFGKEKVTNAFWYQPTGPGSTLHNKRHHPVVQVSLEDALAFAAWTGKRLPTEFEWEAAARTQAGNIYPWGYTWQEDRCNYEKSALSDTTPVDNYPDGVNELGIADLLGNVLEWTADETAPLFGSVRKNRYHIAKGGSWLSDSRIELSNRFRIEIGFTSNILGFRCVAD